MQSRSDLDGINDKFDEAYKTLMHDSKEIVSDLKKQFEVRLYKRNVYKGFKRLKYDDHLKELIKVALRKYYNLLQEDCLYFEGENKALVTEVVEKVIYD